MGDHVVSRGFRGRRPAGETKQQLPPGQYAESGFPVLSAGPTPHTPLDRWSFSIEGMVGQPRRWTWNELGALPRETLTRDIHCVTKWSKLGTRWEGVSVDTLLAGVDLRGAYVMAFCDGGYTTNLPIEDLTGGKAWIVDTYEGQPLAPEHGGPVRLLVPHLYFWKSAKWVRGLRIMDRDQHGFWESFGYHNHGDPWNEERYSGD
jgi:DMSO/TMAO reductase YedYZ molybdopterin-dependent catalytic subunit